MTALFPLIPANATKRFVTGEVGRLQTFLETSLPMQALKQDAFTRMEQTAHALVEDPTRLGKVGNFLKANGDVVTHAVKTQSQAFNPDVHQTLQQGAHTMREHLDTVVSNAFGDKQLRFGDIGVTLNRSQDKTPAFTAQTIQDHLAKQNIPHHTVENMPGRIVVEMPQGHAPLEFQAKDGGAIGVFTNGTQYQLTPGADNASWTVYSTRGFVNECGQALLNRQPAPEAYKTYVQSAVDAVWPSTREQLEKVIPLAPNASTLKGLPERLDMRSILQSSPDPAELVKRSHSNKSLLNLAGEISQATQGLTHKLPVRTTDGWLATVNHHTGTDLARMVHQADGTLKRPAEIKAAMTDAIAKGELPGWEQVDGLPGRFRYTLPANPQSAAPSSIDDLLSKLPEPVSPLDTVDPAEGFIPEFKVQDLTGQRPPGQAVAPADVFNPYTQPPRKPSDGETSIPNFMRSPQRPSDEVFAQSMLPPKEPLELGIGDTSLAFHTPSTGWQHLTPQGEVKNAREMVNHLKPQPEPNSPMGKAKAFIEEHVVGPMKDAQHMAKQAKQARSNQFWADIENTYPKHTPPNPPVDPDLK